MSHIAPVAPFGPVAPVAPLAHNVPTVEALTRPAGQYTKPVIRVVELYDDKLQSHIAHFSVVNIEAC